jgi:hypothetical protein
MSYEIKYENLDSAETKAKAIEDCKDWLGSHFDKVVEILAHANPDMSPNLVRLGLSMQGIQGYPADVLIETYLGKAVTQ